MLRINKFAVNLLEARYACFLGGIKITALLIEHNRDILYCYAVSKDLMAPSYLTSMLIRSLITKIGRLVCCTPC